MPVISVLIPYYNDEAFLKESIQSVLNQTYTDFELVLINHACSDGSRKIAHSFDDGRIVHVDMPVNAGAGGGVIFDAFLNVARGDYLKLFCADDVMKPDCLARLVNYFELNPEKGVVFGNAQFIDKNGDDINKKWSERYEDFSFCDSKETLLKKYFEEKTFLPLPASMFRRCVVEDMKIDMSLIMQFDQSLWIQMLIAGRDFGFINEVVVCYRIHDGQESSETKWNEIERYQFFEYIVRAKIFFRINSFGILKSVVPDCSIMDELDERDSAFFAFAIARYYLEKPISKAQEIAGYEYIHDCLEDPVVRKSLYDRFGFGVAEFRALYKNARLFECAQTGGGSREQGVRELLALLARRLVKKIVQLQ